MLPGAQHRLRPEPGGDQVRGGAQAGASESVETSGQEHLPGRHSR